MSHQKNETPKAATHVRCSVIHTNGFREEINMLKIAGGPLPSIAGYIVDFRHDQIRGADRVRVEFVSADDA